MSTKKITSIYSLGLKRKLPTPIKPKEPELTNEDKLQTAVHRLESIISNMKHKATQREQDLTTEINALNIKVDENKFTVDRFKHNKAYFNFTQALRAMTCLN